MSAPATDQLTRLIRDRLAEIIAAHHTGADGCWVKCNCDKHWRGLDQWSAHLASELLSEIFYIYDSLPDKDPANDDETD